MTEKHPYLSGNAGLVQAVNQLRKSFPAQVSFFSQHRSYKCDYWSAPGKHFPDTCWFEWAVRNKFEDAVLFYAQVTEAKGKTSEAGSIESRRARCRSLEHQW
jgi:hypothetical protein